MSYACAKVILGGEHSVVHRGRALCLPIPQLTLHIEESPTAGLTVNGKPAEPELWTIVHGLALSMGAPSSLQGLSIRSTIPLAAGLGSSASLCVALARKYARLEGEALARRALEGEKLFHGTPSGVDPYTVALEMPLVFDAKNRSWRRLETKAFENSGLLIAVKDTGKPHATSEAIAAVSGLRTRAPREWESIVDALAANADAMTTAFETKPELLGDLMNDSQERLRKLGVSSPELESTLTEMHSAGALGAKLTGAGLGGCSVGVFQARGFREDGGFVRVFPRLA